MATKYPNPIYRCALVREGSIDTTCKMDGSKAARQLCNQFLADSPCEVLLCVLLDTKNRVIGAVPITQGTLDASLVHPREFFRPAIIANASSVILAHNHPSGDLTPSPQDEEVFNRLKKCGSIVGIEVVDSIIVDGVGGSLSMREIV